MFFIPSLKKTFLIYNIFMIAPDAIHVTGINPFDISIRPRVWNQMSLYDPIESVCFFFNVMWYVSHNKYFMTKRKPKPKKTYKVYCTYYPDGSYYIGFSTKSGKAYDKYFGSNKEILALVKENPDSPGLIKETLYESEKRSYAKMQEFLLQWANRADPLMLNDMINIRLRMSYLKDFEPLVWKPKTLAEVAELTSQQIS
jgi:hypothetical protein